MKKAEILKRVIVLPVIIGIVLGIIFCIGFNLRSSQIFSLADGMEFVYHDNFDEAYGETAGVLIFNNEKIDIKFDNSYSNLANSVVVEDVGNGFDEIGCVYLKGTQSMLESIEANDNIEIEFHGKNISYKLIEKLDDKTEYEITHYSPNASKSVVIYCQGAKNGGILNAFNALVFEEVE